MNFDQTATRFDYLGSRNMRYRLIFLLVVAFACLVPVAVAAAPNATTGAATFVSNTGAVLNGTVDPNGVATTYYFEYGKTTSYGTKTTERSAGNNNGAIAVNAAISGLVAGTTYHYRVVAVGDGTTRGADKTFKPGAPEPSKLELSRATIDRSHKTIDILAPITARASGNVSLELRAAGQTYKWAAPINSADARIRDRQTIPAKMAAKGTGILTIRYAGDADTRPQVVRLRAANNQAGLDASRPTITAGVLRAAGTISRSARGVVRVQLEYYYNGVTTTLQKNAVIANGQWKLETPLSAAEQTAINNRRGVVHSYILFTGYERARMRGEMLSYEVLGNR